MIFFLCEFFSLLCLKLTVLIEADFVVAVDGGKHVLAEHGQVLVPSNSGFTWVRSKATGKVCKLVHGCEGKLNKSTIFLFQRFIVY